MSDSTNFPARPTLATLRPESGADGDALAVTHTTARIGQGPQNDIVLDDDTVSTNHAVLEFGDGGWRLTDLDSRNGTYVGGVRLAPRVPTPIPANAALAFGAVAATFQALEDVEFEPVPAGPVASESHAAVRRAGFRLPVWLVALVLVLIAVVVIVFLTVGGGASAVSLDASPEAIPSPILHLDAA